MKIKYEFIFENNRLEVFILNFNDSTLNLESFPVEINEPWTKLEFKQCKVCTLKTTEHKYCPVARNLSYVMLQFKDDVSYEKVKVQVTTEMRITEKHASLQEGISTLMGLIMATSGCPNLDKFKPMAFIHLPFSGEIETIFRAISMYITAQYVRKKNNLKPDWDLKHFRDMYSAVNQINYDFAERLKAIKGRDANINALILLDLFAQAGSLSFSENWMKELEPLFAAYLKE
jgi:hypothetical protein